MALKFVEVDFPFCIMSSEADTDYLLVRMMHFSGFGFWARAGFFAQMACEKYLKAITIQEEGKFANNSHKLMELLGACESYDLYFRETETRVRTHKSA